MSRSSYVKIETIKQGSRQDRVELTYLELKLLVSALESLAIEQDDIDEDKRINKLLDKIKELA